MNPGGLRQRIGEFPAYFAGLAVVTLLAIAGGAVAWRQVRDWRALEDRCERLRIERSLPQARPEMVVAAREALAADRRKVAEARRRWPGPEVRLEVAPIEAFARLAGFRKHQRRRAAELGVEVAGGCDWGFSKYRVEAPAPAEVGVVLEDLSHVSRALEMLYSAVPRQVRAVRLADVDGSEARAAKWALPASCSVQVPGLIRARALQVEFDGSAACLRRFLNGLAAVPGMVVRDVAVAPRESPRSAGPRGAAPDAGVRSCVVTIEAVELAGGTCEATDRIDLGDTNLWRAPESGGGLFGADRSRAVFGAQSPSAPVPGIQLLRVTEAPFRWRLVGCAGSLPHCAAIIEDRETRRTIRLMEGGSDPRSGITLRSVVIRAAKDGTRRACATIVPSGDDAPVELVLGEDSQRIVVAEVKASGDGDPLLLRVGDVFDFGGERLRVVAISAAPAGVTLRRIGGTEDAALVLSVEARSGPRNSEDL